MKLGVALEGALAGMIRQAVKAEQVGLALGWLPAGDATLPALAAIGTRTSSLRIAACERVGAHPLEIAEGAAVADNTSNGRVVLVLEAGEGDGEVLGETADAVLAALAPRPFRHQGARWRIPANLKFNEDPEERIVLRPPPVQTELPVWLSGAPEQASARGLSHVAGNAPEAEWAAAEALLGRAAARLRRPAVRGLDVTTDGGFDADAVVAGLRAEQRAWGLDTTILRFPAALAEGARLRAIARIATHVAPRVIMHELPSGVEEYWRRSLR